MHMEPQKMLNLATSKALCHHTHTVVLGHPVILSVIFREKQGRTQILLIR